MEEYSLYANDSADNYKDKDYEDYWYPDDELRSWIDSIAQNIDQWFDPDLTIEGTPVYQSQLTVREVLASIPSHYVGTGGKSVVVEASDGTVAIVMEDWLDGCIPKPMQYQALEDGYFDYYDRPDEGGAYCIPCAERIRERVAGRLGPSWELVLNQVFCNRSSRFAWMLNR